jgi:RNA-directed DNA polymerase
MLDIAATKVRLRRLEMQYADDCNIYVRSQRAGERVMTSIELFLTKRTHVALKSKNRTA